VSSFPFRNTEAVGFRPESMGSSLSSRLNASELQALQTSTAFTKDDLLELYSQFRFLSDNQKTITRRQFEVGLTATGMCSFSASFSDSKAESDAALGSSDGAEFIRPPAESRQRTRSRVESLLYRLYDVMYRAAHNENPPEDPGADKGLNFHEFCAALSAFIAPDPEVQLEAVFRLFDESGDDKISENELYRALGAINALLELPELSTDECDDQAEVRKTLHKYARELVSVYGVDGALTLPQFKDAVREHPSLRELGQRIVVEACSDFFHKPSSCSSSTGQVSYDPTLAKPQPHVVAHGAALKEEEGVLLRPSSFVHQVSSIAPNFSFAAAKQDTRQPSLGQCSLAHVLVHVYPRMTKQQISFVAQRHRAEFTHRQFDRIMHLVIVEHAKDSPVTPDGAKVLHAELQKVLGERDREHLAVKPIAVDSMDKGLSDDDLEAIVTRFTDANPSDIVRLPPTATVAEHAHLVPRFKDLALVTGHGYELVRPDTAPHASVRRARNFVFCAEHSAASERAARLIGLMLNPRFNDICVVETIWHVSMNSFAHAYSDSEKQWKAHLATMKQTSLKVAEHFKARIAHGVACSAVAETHHLAPSVVAAGEYPVEVTATTDEVARRVVVGTAEESNWDTRLVQLLKRTGYLMPTTAGQTAPSETVVVVGLESRSMAQKLYASVMSTLRKDFDSLQTAQDAVGFIFVN
jgi:Ca2+-binding EF-hand superfamily protein